MSYWNRTSLVRPWLLVHVNGGLGNRLRVAATARPWAVLAGRNVRIGWSTSGDFGAHLDDLFEHDLPLINPVAPRAAAALFGWRTPSTLSLEDRGFVRAVGTGRQFRGPNGRELDPGPELRRFRAAAEVAARVHAIPPKDGPRIGLMIRVGADAMAKTKSASPPDWFVRRVTELRRTGIEFDVFLSADVPEVAQRVEEAVPRVHRLRAKRPHNSRLGLVDAAADLILLSRCDYILGSHASSFSEVAASMSGHGGYETSRTAPREAWEARVARTTS